MIESHEIAKLFPLMSEEEIAELAEDIRANGLREPIVLYKNQILDGRNRYRACLKAEVEPQFTDYGGAEDRLLEYVISKNLRRRHLTVIQIALLAFDLVPYYTEAALIRKRVGRGGMSAEQELERGKTAERVGAIVGCSADTVRRMIAINKVDPKLIQRMREGEFQSIRQASLVAGLVVSHHRTLADRQQSVREQPPRGEEIRDQWESISSALWVYLNHWLQMSFDHIDKKEATKRVATIDRLQKGLAELREELELVGT